MRLCCMDVLSLVWMYVDVQCGKTLLFWHMHVNFCHFDFKREVLFIKLAPD